MDVRILHSERSRTARFAAAVAGLVLAATTALPMQALAQAQPERSASAPTAADAGRAAKGDRLAVLDVYSCMFAAPAGREACGGADAAQFGRQRPTYSTVVRTDTERRLSVLERVPTTDARVAMDTSPVFGPDGPAFAYGRRAQ